MTKKQYIIGILAVVGVTLTTPKAHASSLCHPGNIDSQYMRIYCDIRLDGNDDLDEELISLMSKQFDLDEEVIEGIIGGTICDTVEKLSEEEVRKLPKSVQNACQPEAKTIAEVFDQGWNSFQDIRNSYQKEKMMRQSAKALKFRFEVSEQYWDGTINTTPGIGGDAPFDLIVDLNLIEIVLFGSKAQWMNDVFSYPKKDDETPENNPLLNENNPEDGGETTGETDPEADAVSVSQEEDKKATIECVPPDDPEADLGNGPSSENSNTLCGNGIMDILMGETCDDGNQSSGDGCNQYCQKEATGSNDLCIDPDAITFKSPEEVYGNDNNMGETQENDSQNQCPPGTVPKKSDQTSGEGFEDNLPQAPEYPGSFLGGTLKQFPENERPICDPGTSPVAITIKGETQYNTDSDGNVRCIPTEYCMDPEITRDFLASSTFGVTENWRDLPDNDERKAWIESIESLFCVNIIKANRPASAYAMIEGCIDCHISAMVDSLEKALQTNVTPLANTSSAFEISNKFGPNMSYNLNTALKGKTKYKSTDTIEKAVQKADQQTKKFKMKTWIASQPPPPT